MTASSVIELMPSTLEQVQTFSQMMKNSILNGEFDYKKFLYQKNMIEKTLSVISDDEEVKDFIQNEIEKYGKEGVGFNDLNFQLQGRKTWDYSKTEDSELFKLEKQKKELEMKIKERQKLLQTAKKPFADIETGEIIHPASYSEKTFIKSSVKK